MPFPLHHRAVHDWDARRAAGVAKGVAGGQVVEAIHDEVVSGHQPGRRGGIDEEVVDDEVNRRIDGGQSGAGGLGLASAHVGDPVEWLAVQVGEVDAVEVAQSDRTNAGADEGLRGRTTQPAKANDEHLGLMQGPLSGFTDLRQAYLAGVSQVGHGAATGTTAMKVGRAVRAFKR